MSIIDDLLKKYDLKYEDLNSAERETLTSWLKIFEQGGLSTEKIKEYIATMRFSVEQELVKTDNGSKQDIFLKARLRNYMLLEAFLVSPEKAKKALEAALGNLKK